MKLRNKKTGEVKECIVIPIDSNGYPNEYEVFEKGESLAELNEEWEDYKEPLIKDAKIRKAVRAWAEAVGGSPYVFTKIQITRE